MDRPWKIGEMVKLNPIFLPTRKGFRFTLNKMYKVHYTTYWGIHVVDDLGKRYILNKTQKGSSFKPISLFFRREVVNTTKILTSLGKSV